MYLQENGQRDTVFLVLNLDEESHELRNTYSFQNLERTTEQISTRIFQQNVQFYQHSNSGPVRHVWDF